MKKIFVSHFLIVAVFLMLFISLKSYALDYTITFAGKNASDMVDSVIVQNLTQGMTVTVPAGNGLNLKDIPTSIEHQLENEQTVRVFSNSARDKSIVLFFAKQSGNTQINVFGIDGKKIIGINKDLSVGENSFQLSLLKGIYVIRIAGNGYFYTAKVIGQDNANSKPDIDFLGNMAAVSPKNSENVQLRKSSATSTMLYAEGDRLLFKGASGQSKTIVTDVPTQSKMITFNFVDCTDPDNNHYAVVQIGNQVWMVENLKTTKYRNGESIGTTNSAHNDIRGESEPKYQWAYNGDESNVLKYGRLYTWYAVNDSRNLAPTGWNIASDDEWTTLENYLIDNGYNYDGTTIGNGIAKSLAATTDWNSYSDIGVIGDDLTKNNNNTSGFSALAGGFRELNGRFSGIDSNGNWWSSIESNVSSVWFRGLYYYLNYLYRGSDTKSYGFSVRCVRDVNTPVLEAPTLGTTATNNIKTTSATSGGIITNDGGAAITASGVCWNTSPSPTTANSKTTDGTGLGGFTSIITYLTANTPYYVRAYATNSVGTSYGSDEFFTTLSEDTVADIDGNVYHTVTIGTQTWMVENLKTTKYRNGESIGTTTPADKDIHTESAPKYQWAYNGDESNASKYGRLYTWHAVNDGRNLAPTGWHVPSDAEWTTLENYLIANGYNYDGTTSDNKIAKSLAATTDWNSYTETGTVGNDPASNNSSGFSGLSGGTRDNYGTYDLIGYGGYWWSSTATDSTNAWDRTLFYGIYSLIQYDNYSKSNGFSVRCVKDDNTPVLEAPTLSTTAANNIKTTSATSGGIITNDGGAAITASGVCWNTSPSPTTANSKTTDGTGLGGFTSIITYLTANTPYYVRAYATNSVGTSYGSDEFFTTLSDTVTDIDGNIYHTVTIGTQTWMVENLNTTKYRNGESIGTTTPTDKDITNESEPKYQWAYNGDESNASKYGRIYTWYAVDDSRNLAPTGWHVASDAEWTTLENYLIANGYNYDGTTAENKIAKSLAATTDWNSYTGTGNIGADLTKNNTSGFTALPGGYRYYSGTFYEIGLIGDWWSSTEDHTASAWFRGLSSGNYELYRNYNPMSCGFSVRCVRDQMNP